MRTNWRASSLRTPPTSRLVSAERLTPDQTSWLASLSHEPDLYGLFLPGPGSLHGPTAVSCSTALLLTALREPGRVPAFALRRSAAELDQTLQRLVSDGLLEVELDGVFLTGAAAMEGLQTAAGVAARTRIERLSQTALRQAALLQTASVPEVTGFLYRYNTQPLRFPAAQSSPAFEGLVAQITAAGRHLRAGTMEEHRGGDAWRGWTRAGEETANRHDPLYKLYISPASSALGQAFAAAAMPLSSSEAIHVKVGSTPTQVLRPDKLVAYFRTQTGLRRAADKVLRALGPLPAQPVPFTASIDDEGLASWGLDPPDVLAWQPRGSSYRQWLVQRLASAIVRARSGHARDPVAFASERLRLDGIDTATWTPSLRLFAAELDAHE